MPGNSGGREIATPRVKVKSTFKARGKGELGKVGKKQ